jgi:hypothetical protein
MLILLHNLLEYRRFHNDVYKAISIGTVHSNIKMLNAVHSVVIETNTCVDWISCEG